MINVEEWAEIRRMHKAEGMGVKAGPEQGRHGGLL